MEFEAGNGKKYKVEAIWDNTVYANKAKSHLLGLYYLIAWKKYPEKENTWELSFTVLYLKKLINSFYKKHLEKPTATFLPINFTLLIARPTVKPTRFMIKQKRGQSVRNANKQARNSVLDAYNI